MKVKVNKIDLYYEVYGSGEPLILLHGNGETHKIFDCAIKILQEKYTVYAIDTRGHGESSEIAEYHYTDMAEDIKCFITQQNIEKPILYGFSDGGIIGLLLATTYPTMLSKLIISGANTAPDGIRKEWLKLFCVINAVVKEPKMTMMFHEPNITAEQLANIQIPTLVLAGSKDMVKKEHTLQLASNIKNCTLRILPKEGHGSYIVNSDKIAKLIIDFCK